ncbi:MAG: hypothetical protein DWQ04_14920, partial [Chloroflexi bacterium]
MTAVGSLLGTPDYISPEQLRNELVSPPTDIYSLGAVLYEMLTGERPFPNIPIAMLIKKQLEEPIPLVSASRPDLPRQIDTVIQRATAKQPSDRFSNALALADAFRHAIQDQTPIVIKTDSPVAVPTTTHIINPYKGLRAFQESDANNFYGREALVEQLAARLADNPFLAVVGPSGSGKSSLVKAGLIPALRQEAIPGSDTWFVADMVPGDHPLEELELALLPIAVNPPPDLVGPMQKDERGLLRTIRRILPGEENAQLLLVIDQFEELFTLVNDNGRRLHFLNSLMIALNAPRSPLRIVVTLRADFYDRPLQIQPIANLFKQHVEIVLPLNQEELTWAIREPARQVGVSMADSVVTAMVTDVIDQPGTLPLLQYALTELFEARHGNAMTLAAYQSLGGVSGALAQRAEDLFARFDEAGQEAARQLFLRLVTLGEGGADTRRRVVLSQLQTLRVSETLRVFGNHRLLTFDHDPLTREPTVEVAHEALLREWPRLRRWLDQSRDDVRLQRSLSSFAREWVQNNQADGFLLRRSRLDLFADWAKGLNLALTPDEQSFLKASIAARERREFEEQARRQQELETIQQLAQERILSRSRELTFAATHNLDIDPELSVLLVLEALNTEYTREAEGVLHQAIQASHMRQRFIGHTEETAQLAYTPDGTKLVSTSRDGTAKVWDVATGAELLSFDNHGDKVFTVAIDPTGEWAVTGGMDGNARVWDLDSGAERRIFSGLYTPTHWGQLDLSSDGSLLAIPSQNNSVKILDTTTGKEIQTLTTTNVVENVQFSPD